MIHYFYYGAVERYKKDLDEVNTWSNKLYNIIFKHNTKNSFTLEKITYYCKKINLLPTD